jgi:hypothetical protein
VAISFGHDFKRYYFQDTFAHRHPDLVPGVLMDNQLLGLTVCSRPHDNAKDLHALTAEKSLGCGREGYKKHTTTPIGNR